MNNKGQIALGAIIIGFIGIIVAASLIPTIGDNVGTMINTVSEVNGTYTMGAANVTIDLDGQEYIGNLILTNASGGEIISATNYTIGEGVSATTGGKSVQLTTNAELTPYSGTPVNASYDYGADGYADSSGARGMARLIPIVTALALLGFAVYIALAKAGWLKA